MGIDVASGAAFHCDPLGWVVRPDVPISNPNIMSFGKPGMGKSGTTKAFILRMMDFGYRTLVLGDPKDEYEPLCRILGVDPISLGPGLPARINPLAFGPLGQHWDTLGPGDRLAGPAYGGLVCSVTDRPKSPIGERPYRFAGRPDVLGAQDAVAARQCAQRGAD